MARYVIKDEVSTGIKESLKKWGEIPIHTEHLDGVIKIKNYRKYTWAEEVDATFEGKIFVRVGIEKKTWYTTSVLDKYRISKVKLNRFLRKSILFEVKTRMKYFGVDVNEYYNITKIKWE
jgi:hypothetical protein